MARYGSANVAAAGTSGTPSDATQLTRLGVTSSFIISNLNTVANSGVAGVLLPTNPVTGDEVELYGEAQGGTFILYSAVNGVSEANNYPDSRYHVLCRYTGPTNGWYVV